jgi:hypothetical protein
MLQLSNVAWPVVTREGRNAVIVNAKLIAGIQPGLCVS